jgi:hypothetical protein
LETGVQRLTEHWQKFVEDVGEFEENSLINAEGVGIIHVNLIFVTITFSEKEIGGTLTDRPISVIINYYSSSEESIR